MKRCLLLLLLHAPRVCIWPRSIPRRRRSFVRQYAGHYRVPPELVAALIDVESRWNPRALSSKGAMGLMQLMPATAQALRRLRTLRCRTEHRRGHALRDGIDVGVPRGSAPGRRGLLRGRPWDRAGAIELSQSGRCGLRAGGPAAVHDSQICGREAAEEVNAMKVRWFIPHRTPDSAAPQCDGRGGWSACRHHHDQPERDHGPASAAGV